MATGQINLDIGAAWPDASNPPAVLYTTANRPYLAFDASTDEKCLWVFRLPDEYSSAPTVEIDWGAASATSDNVVWAVEVMAITPESDTADAATDSFDATPNTTTDAHLGTTAGRLHTATVTLTNIDSAAAGDYLVLRLSRDADNASDTMTGDAYVHTVTMFYTTA